MTTEPSSRPNAPARKPRASKASLRTAAWAAAGVGLATPFVALNAQPRPAPADAGAKARRVIIVHRTIRRIVIDPPAQVAAAPAAAAAAPSVRYVYVGGGTVTTGGGTSGTTRCSGC